MKTKVIMHENCLDVAFEAWRCHTHKPGHVTYKGRWINLGYTGNPWPISYEEKLAIPTSKLQEWKDITDKINVVRKKSGVPT